MPRPVTPLRTAVQALGSGTAPLDVVLGELQTLLEARREEYQAAADRITDILTSMSPKPQTGRPRTR